MAPKRFYSNESSSDLPETVSLPRHAPKNRSKPHPKDSEPITFSSDSDNESVAKAQTSKKRLTFGSIKDGEGVEPSTEIVPKRTRKPLEKARYMAAEVISDSESEKSPSKKRRINKPTTPSKEKQGHVSESWEEWSSEDTPKLSKNDRNAAPPPSSPKTPKKENNPDVRVRKRQDRRPLKHRAEPSDGSDSGVASATPVPRTSQRGKDMGKKRAQSPDTPIPAPSSSQKSRSKGESRVWSPDSPSERPKVREAKTKNKGKGRARSPEPSSENPDGSDEPSSVRRSEEKTPTKSNVKTDDVTKVDYPEMPTRCASFSSYKHLPHTFSLEGHPSNLVSRERFYYSLHKKYRLSVRSALDFTRDGSMINPSRSRLHNINVGQGGRLVFGRDDNALCIFNGAVTYCSLVDPTSINGANIRCISLYPFKDDFIQWKDFIASAVQRTDFITTTDNDVISFMTRKEKQVDDSTAGGSKSSEPVQSPKKAGMFFEDADQTTANKPSFLKRVPHSLAYTERVPIYDARDTDFCLQEHFNEIHGLPIYEGGKEDLPQFAVVTVGHTISTFAYVKEKSTTALQLHVVFVLLHGFIKNGEPAK